MSKPINVSEFSSDTSAQVKLGTTTGKLAHISSSEAKQEGIYSRVTGAVGRKWTLFKNDFIYICNNRPKLYLRAKRVVYDRVFESAKIRVQDYLIDRVVNDLASSDTTGLDEEVTSGALKTLYAGLGGAAGAATLGSVVGPTAGSITGSVVAGVAMRKSGAHDYIQERVKGYTKELRLALVSGNQEAIKEALKNIAHPEDLVGTKKTCIDSDSELPSNRPSRDQLLEEHFNAMIQDAVLSALSTYIHVRMHDCIANATDANTGIIGFNSQILGTMSWLVFIRDPAKIQNALEYHLLGYKVSSKKRRENAVKLMNAFYGEDSSSLDYGVHRIQKKNEKTSFGMGVEYIQTKGVISIGREGYQAAAEKAGQAAGKVHQYISQETLEDKSAQEKGFFVRSGEYLLSVKTHAYSYTTTSRPYLFLANKLHQISAYFTSSFNARVNRGLDYAVDKAIEKIQEPLLEKLLSEETNFVDELIAGGVSGPIMQQVYYQFDNYYLAETIARVTPLEGYGQQFITKVLTPAVSKLRQTLVDVDPNETVLDSMDNSSVTRDAVIEELVAAYQESMIMEGVEVALEEALPLLVARMLQDPNNSFDLQEFSQGFALEVASRMIVAKLKPVLLKALEKKMFQKQVLSNERLENGKQILAKMDNCKVEDISLFTIVMEHKKAQVTKKAKETLNSAYEMALGIFSRAKAQVEALIGDEDVDSEDYDKAVLALENADKKAKEVLAQAQLQVEQELKVYSVPGQEIIFEAAEKGQKLIDSGQELIGQITAEKAAKAARMTVVTGGMLYFEWFVKPLNNMLIDFGFGTGQEEYYQ